MFCIYVDDFAVAVSDSSLIDGVCTKLPGNFPVNSNGGFMRSQLTSGSKYSECYAGDLEIHGHPLAPVSEASSLPTIIPAADGFEVFTSYFASLATSDPSSQPVLATDFICYATKSAARTAENPTFAKARKGEDGGL